MIQKKITYTDFDGTERTEVAYFNLTKTELEEMNLSHHGNYADQLQAIVNAKDIPTVMALFKAILMKAYGIKSEDGRHFRKSEAISKDFEDSAMYDALMIEMLQNEDSAAELFLGMIPADMQAAAKDEIAKNKKLEAAKTNE